VEKHSKTWLIGIIGVALLATAPAWPMLYRSLWGGWCAYRFRTAREDRTYKDTDALAYQLFLCGRIKPGMRSEDIFRLLGPPTWTTITESGIKRCEWDIAQDYCGASGFVITFDADDRAVFVPKPYTKVGSDGRAWSVLYTRPEDEARDKARENR